MKLLDNYYLILTRWHNAKFHLAVIRIMSLFFLLNFMSLVFLVYPNIIDDVLIFLLSFVVPSWLVYWLLDRRYTIVFRDKVLEKDESDDSYMRKSLWVIAYWGFSVLLFVLAIIRVVRW